LGLDPESSTLDFAKDQTNVAGLCWLGYLCIFSIIGHNHGFPGGEWFISSSNGYPCNWQRGNVAMMPVNPWQLI